MKRNNIIAGLEIGHTKVSLIAGEIRDGEFVFLNASKVDCLGGVRKGTIVNLDAVTEAIIKLTEEIGQKTGKRINSTFVNISGLNIKQEVVNSVITLPQRGSEIGKRNINDLIGSCKIVSIPLDRHLLYLSVLEYIIDGQDGIKEPIGLCGSRLEARVLIITAPFNQVQNIIKTINSAGLEVEEVVLTIVANSCAVLTEEERKEGVLVIDFKTDMTEVSLFKEGEILFFETLTKGQQDIANEIAARLNIPLELAEELKIRYGFLDTARGDSRHQETIPLEWLGKSQNILRGELNKIIDEDLGLIFDLILDKLKDVKGFNDLIRRGAVLVGGCTSMEGFLEWANSKLGLTVREGILREPSHHRLRNTGYIVASGLVEFGLGKTQVRRPKDGMNFFKRVYQKADELLADYF